MTRTHRNQFTADYAPPAGLLAAFAAGGWADNSWGNDPCPRFTRGGLSVWCEHPDPDRRECGGRRYTLTADGPDGDLDMLAETDDAATAAAWSAAPEWADPVEWAKPVSGNPVNPEHVAGLRDPSL